jgi:hypothetical protein
VLIDTDAGVMVIEPMAALEAAGAAEETETLALAFMFE